MFIVVYLYMSSNMVFLKNQCDYVHSRTYTYLVMAVSSIINNIDNDMYNDHAGVLSF